MIGLGRVSSIFSRTYIVISSVLARRHGPSAFLLDLLEDLGAQVLSDMHALRLRWECDGWDRVRVLGDEPTLSLIPLLEQRVVGRAPDEARVGDADKADAGDVSGGRVDTYRDISRCGDESREDAPWKSQIALQALDWNSLARVTISHVTGSLRLYLPKSPPPLLSSKMP